MANRRKPKLMPRPIISTINPRKELTPDKKLRELRGLKRGTMASASLNRLGRTTGLSSRPIRDTMRRLKEDGIISVRREVVRSRPTVCQLHFEKAPLKEPYS